MVAIPSSLENSLVSLDLSHDDKKILAQLVGEKTYNGCPYGFCRPYDIKRVVYSESTQTYELLIAISTIYEDVVTVPRKDAMQLKMAMARKKVVSTRFNNSRFSPPQSQNRRVNKLLSSGVATGSPRAVWLGLASTDDVWS